MHIHTQLKLSLKITTFIYEPNSKCVRCTTDIKTYFHYLWPHIGY